MDMLGYNRENCSIARSLGILGEKWTLLVLREAFFGLRRFEDFLRALGCPRNVLSARLRTLVLEGVLVTEAYREPGRRTRNEYRLTEKGAELFPVLLALMEWGDRWLAPSGPPALARHRGCGERVHVQLRCVAGHDALSAADVEPALGPGARAPAS